MGHKSRINNGKARKTQRRKAAEHRAEMRALRTDRDQVARLDRILGHLQGASKERARLAERIEAQGV